MKLQVTITREVTEATTIELDVRANDVRAFMRDKGLGLERDDDWVDYADRYIEHQVDLQEEVLQSRVDIESQGESEWEVKEVTR